MFGLTYILNKLRYRNLELRARQFADVYFNDNTATVYPIEILAGKGNAKTVMVLAPHADDETLGAAGAILHHIQTGDKVIVVLISDREMDDVENARHLDSHGSNSRESEFRAAQERLGVDSHIHLHLAEEEYSQNPTKNDALTRVFVENQPDVLYLPSLFDNHQDHRIVNVWAGFALNHIPHKDVLCRGYEVWTPLPATAVLDITPFFETKQQAIRCYKSQLANIRYDHHIAGLNAYRAMTFGKRASFAEAFFEASAQQYQELVKQYLVS